MAKELLKDVTIRTAKPLDKDYRLNDGEGLYVIIKTNGAKWWRFDYTFSGKRKTDIPHPIRIFSIFYLLIIKAFL